MFTGIWRALARLRALFGRAALDHDFSEELESHVAMLTDEHVRRGLSTDEAQRLARQQVGSRTSLEADHRAARGLPVVDATFQDLRFGFRQLWAHRGFALAAIGVLTLGVAANLAIFGFVDAALIRPLPYTEPARLVTAFSTRPDRAQGQVRNQVSYLNLVDWRAQGRPFSALAAFDVRAGFVLRTSEGPERVSGLRVTNDFFRTLGVRPVLGRDFRQDEEGRSAPPVVILAYRAWLTRFGGKSDVLGKAVTLQGQPHVVIGVLPKDFYFPLAEHADFWLTIRGSQPCWESRGCRSLQTIARLADGTSIDGARAALDRLIQQLRSKDGNTTQETAAVAPLTDEVFGDVRPILLALFDGVGLLLLIASINVVSLLLARSDGRLREIAVRNAMGASSSRLLRQFAAESALLVGSGTLLGLLLARWAMQALVRLVDTDVINRMPYLQGVGLNARLFVWAMGLAIVATGVFTLAPMARLAAARRFDALKESSRTSAGMSWRRLGRALVIGELAIASVLLVSAGLLAKSAYRLLHVDTGFNTAHLVVTNVNPLPSPGREAPEGLAAQIAERVRAMPGVEAVGYADLLPVSAGLAPTSGFHVPGRVSNGVTEDHPVRRVSAGYFAALQATLLSGRLFTENEVTPARDVAIINETAAKRYFPGEDPIGKSIEIGAPPARQIVGVIGDIKDGPLETPLTPAAYVPFDQLGFGLVIRISRGDLAGTSLTKAIREIRPNVLIQSATTMAERIEAMQSALLKRAFAWLIAGFAAMALILSVIGLYGVVAYSVGQRSREIGIRMALGAGRRTVYQLIIGESAWLVLIGTGIGTVAAVFVAALTSRLLFATDPWDVPTLAAGALVLIVPALVASVVPAFRATRLNPVEALRAE
jgi:macrolide transport system ATP-binding/permease protein